MYNATSGTYFMRQVAIGSFGTLRHIESGRQQEYECSLSTKDIDFLFLFVGYKSGNVVGIHVALPRHERSWIYSIDSGNKELNRA